MLAGSAVLLVLFVAVQRRTEQRTGSSLLPMHLFANRGFTAGLVTQSVFQGSLAGFSLVTIIYVQAGLGFSAFHAGLMLLPFSIGAFVGTGVSVPLGLKVGKTVCLVGALFQAVAVWWVARDHRARRHDLTVWSLAPPMLLAGIGLGLLVVPLVDIALATVPETDAGAASGTYGTFQQVGAALGVAVIGSVFFGAIDVVHAGGVASTPTSPPAGGCSAGSSSVPSSTVFLPDRRAVHEHARAQAELMNA